jgi:hypothetical protein
MYTYVCVCVCVCVFMCVYVCMYVYVRMCLQVSVPCDMRAPWERLFKRANCPTGRPPCNLIVACSYVILYYEDAATQNIHVSLSLL